MSEQVAAANGVVVKNSPLSVPDAVDRLSHLVVEKGMKLFAVIDHSGEAQANGLELRDTKVVIFGNPVGGTPVMDAVPLVALDLPLKVLIYDHGGSTRVCYAPPHELARRYRLAPELVARFAGIDALTDALTAPAVDQADGTAN
ncbi:MAG: DUF302 domain-containing protein [Solirubrobacteraceae bacterium]